MTLFVNTTFVDARRRAIRFAPVDKATRHPAEQPDGFGQWRLGDYRDECINLSPQVSDQFFDQ